MNDETEGRGKWEGGLQTYLCVFLLLTVHYGGTAHLRNLLIMSVKCPAAYLAISEDIFQKQNTTAESQSQLIKQFQILQEIIIGVPGTEIDLTVY